ncbi:MAG: Flp family type IVb pilin [Vulcanimicrobiaceae bacterium]
MKRLLLFLVGDGAQAAAEYALIAALVAVVAIGALIFFGDMFGASIERSANAVNGTAQLP